MRDHYNDRAACAGAHLNTRNRRDLIQAHRVSLGALTGRQLAALVEVLAPYRGERITPPLIEVAAKLARLTAPERLEAAQ